MTIHRFTVNIPNPTSHDASVQLRLERAHPADLKSLCLDVPENELKVEGAGIALDPCAVEGEPVLNLDLKPHCSIDVHAIINTFPASREGIAAFHLIDQRDGKLAGGVLLACIDPPPPQPPSQVVATPNPCPATLARNLHWIVPGDDPSKSPHEMPMPPGKNLEIIAQIINPSKKPLKNTRVYIEHLGGSDAELTPGTWNVGTMQPGQIFFATWKIRTNVWQSGTYMASIVVMSQETDPVRLNAKIAIGSSEET
jgi:hypothetical protein